MRISIVRFVAACAVLGASIGLAAAQDKKSEDKKPTEKPAPAKPAEPTRKAESKPDAKSETAPKSADGAKSTSAAKPASDLPTLEVFKKLAGDWEGQAAHGDSPQNVTVNYRVTAAESAVAETLFAGTPHEMVTMYTQDGDSLMLTHYCAAGNQPRMRLAPSSTTSKLSFKFVDGGNMKSPNDPHMHEMTLTIVDVDHITSEWTFYKDGKPGEVARFELKRVKK